MFYFLSKFFTIIIQVFLFHGNMSNYHLLLGKVDVKVRQKEMLTTSVRRPIVLATFACGSKKNVIVALKSARVDFYWMRSCAPSFSRNIAPAH